MSKKTKVAKMFGALVVGGGLLVSCAQAEPESQSDKPTPKETTPPKETTAPKDTSKEASSANRETSSPPTSADPEQPHPTDTHCQLSFTLYKYSRDGVDPVHTCLDDKSDKEILKVIEEAKKQTCASAFCGCWLG
ncbi:MAG: hypothetical protein VX278_19285 [Myxococcota bacterium]|nr:hypothetical protein [Myxococcota bacterium]